MKRSGHAYQAVCLLVAAGILAGVARPANLALIAARDALIPPAQQVGDVHELDSFSLGLMLGGFRGPLVMYLWVSAEEEKNRQETDKFLTRAEFISDLQPQFVHVYVFQSWNLAYNVSVQYSSRREKYRWINEGIRFVETGDRRLPGNTDILTQLGHIYFDKLGGSTESEYYRARFRADSLDQMLDAEHRLKPAYAEQWQQIDRLDGLLAQVESAEASGAAGPLLGRDPAPPGAPRHQWPYGVSVFAVAFDYDRQAAVAVRRRPHSQYGRIVVESRPAIVCRSWADEELNLALSAEGRLWSAGESEAPLPAPTAAALAGPAGRAALDEAVFHYQEAGRIALLGRAAYQTHLTEYPDQGDVYASHLADMEIKQMLAQAGAARLAGMAALLAGGGERAERDARLMLDNARSLYMTAEQRVQSYVATTFRVNPWDRGDPFTVIRARHLRWADHAHRAIAQIDALLAARER